MIPRAIGGMASTGMRCFGHGYGGNRSRDAHLFAFTNALLRHRMSIAPPVELPTRHRELKSRLEAGQFAPNRCARIDPPQGIRQTPTRGLRDQAGGGSTSPAVVPVDGVRTSWLVGRWCHERYRARRLADVSFHLQPAPGRRTACAHRLRRACGPASKTNGIAAFRIRGASGGSRS